MFFISLWIACWFSLEYGKGSGTQNSRDIWSPSFFMQITARYCQHSCKHSGECQSNNLRLAEVSSVWGLRARAPPGRDWHVSFFFQGNSVRHQVIICMVVIMLTQPVGGCHFKWATMESLWFIQIVHSEGAGTRWKRWGEKTRERGGLEESSQFDFTTQLWSHMGLREGDARVRQTGRAMRAGSRDRIWCLNQGTVSNWQKA